MDSGGAWHVLRLQKANSERLNVNVASIRAAEEIELIVRETRHDLDRFLLTKQPNHLVAAFSKEPEYRIWQANAFALSGSEVESKLLAKIAMGMNKCFSRLQELVDTFDKLALGSIEIEPRASLSNVAYSLQFASASPFEHSLAIVTKKCSEFGRRRGSHRVFRSARASSSRFSKEIQFKTASLTWH